MAARKKRSAAPSRALMEQAIAHSLKDMRSGRGGPFGAVVARGAEIVGRGGNRVLSDSDPTAHAEVVAIRDACRKLGAAQLEGCFPYTCCEPCPMCLAAAYWARVARIVSANSRRDAAAIGFGDAFIYQEMALPPGRRKLPVTRFMGREALTAF